MFESVKNEDFMIVSVAMDSDIEAARPWIEAASPDYVTLIDQNHLLSSLYNMVNVPQAVWIDEGGRIVRPVETGGSLDIAQDYDRETRAQAKLTYVQAVKDWAEKGCASRFLFGPDAAKKHVAVMSNKIALAHAKFQLGQYLKRNDRTDEADAIFAECRKLHPESWNIFRETTERADTGLAVGDEFWGKVKSLGDKQYYATIDMPGMPG
jgi:hypothetical protein